MKLFHLRQINLIEQAIVLMRQVLISRLFVLILKNKQKNNFNKTKRTKQTNKTHTLENYVDYIGIICFFTLQNTLNFVQLTIQDHKVVLANVSAVELAYICRLYERLGMSCPYREAGPTAQKCRQISGHADSLFYCTTQELLSLVTSQITSYVMNTHVTVSKY